MTSRYLHRRTSTAATAFPSPVQPGELVVNTANRQLVVGDAASATLGVPLPLLAVRIFDVRAQYAVGDYVVQAGGLYRANAAVSPGAFNPVLWDAVTSSDVTKAYVDAADSTLQTNINAKADKSYVDSQNAAQDTTISGKTSKAYVDAADALKADKTYVDAADALKADKSYVDTQDALKVAKAGDTMTGALTIRGTNPTFIQDAPTTAGINLILGKKNGLTRWDLRVGDDNSESGGNTGSDFSLFRYDDAGNYIGPGPVLQILRATAGISGSSVATAAEYIANSAPTKMLTPGAVWGAASSIANWADSATVTLDFALSIDFTWTIGAAGRTLANPANVKAGQKGVLYIVQGGSGTITAWGTAWKFPGGVKPTLSTNAGSIDAISYAVISSTQIACTFSAAFS